MWTILNDFHIEKSRLPVVVITTEGERLTGDLFVVGNPRNPSGHEEPIELLNAPEPFFPLATLSGRILLCAKSHVRELLIPRDDVTEPDWSLGARADIAVHLAGGSMHKGTIHIEQHSAHQRVLDYLNRIGSRYLQLFTAQGVVLLNREFIIHVEQVS